MPKPSKKPITRKTKKPRKPTAVSRSATRTTRTDTKSSLILKLLGRPSGATVKELAAAASWQDHSVRGFLSGTLKKKLGLVVTSEVIDGARHYRIDRQWIGQ